MKYESKQYAEVICLFFLFVFLVYSCFVFIRKFFFVFFFKAYYHLLIVNDKAGGCWFLRRSLSNSTVKRPSSDIPNGQSSFPGSRYQKAGYYFKKGHRI